MNKQLEHKEVKALRLELLYNQNNICPLCNTYIEVEEAVLDHCHTSGLIRGVLHNICNSIDGNLLHKFKRGGGERYTDFDTYISNLITYRNKEHYPIIHPSEKPKEPKLMKSSYNALIRVLQNANYKKKLPLYPKSKKITKGLRELYTEFNIEPKFHKPKGKK